MHPISESVEIQGFATHCCAENANVPISGYLFSLDAGPAVYRYHPVTGEPIYRKSDKPHWRVDVCAALPDGRGGKGGVGQ